MTKSASAVAREARAAGRAALPPYSSPSSEKAFTQPQLFACLAVREFLKADYRGVEPFLADWSDLRQALGLARVPDHSTLQKAAARLLKKTRPANLTGRLRQNGDVQLPPEVVPCHAREAVLSRPRL